MKIEWGNIAGYVGWVLLVFLMVYLLLKILGVIGSPAFEEVMLTGLFTIALIVGNLQSRVTNLERYVKERFDDLEEQIKELKKALPKKRGKK